jgi:phosphopantetheinyl transferase
MNNAFFRKAVEKTGLSIEILPLEIAWRNAQGMLSANELRRLHRLGELRKKFWLAARWAIKRLGSRRAFDVSPDEIETVCNSTRPCCQMPNGRDYNVSASHDTRYVVAALTPAGTRVGVDVEPIDPRCLRVAARHAPTLPEHPETATRFWSACEAVVKCSGLGLRAVLRSVIPKTTEWGMELGFDDGSVFQVHQIRFDNRIFSVATA